MINARRTFIAAMGGLMGAAGIEHGVGEILQGNVQTQGVMIRSWADSPFFQSLGGEPAMTLLPNLLLTGILAIGFSLIFVIWTVFLVDRKNGGVIMILLAILMLLSGGGIFPPVLGALIGTAAVATQNRPVAQPVTGLRRWFGRQWRWIFTACCLAWLVLFPGVSILSYFFGIDGAEITLAIMVTAISLLFLALWSGVQHDRVVNSVPKENRSV